MTDQAPNNSDREKAGADAGLFRVSITPQHSGERLDRALAEAAAEAGLTLSRTRIQALIADGYVRVDNNPALNPKAKVFPGTQVSVTLPAPVAAVPIAQDLPLAVVFEDEHLLVIDKPAGLVVHPAAGHEDGTLVNALMAHCGDSLSGIGGVRRPGIVHRLDKDTSGLLVVAKTDRAHAGLSAVFADHGRSGSLVREYLAFVYGVPDRAGGSVETDLARDPRNRLRMAVVASGRGRRAITHWSLEESYGLGASRVRCRLETGRTHQIRVHMTTLGHPLMGDPVYGTGFRTKATLLGAAAQNTAAALGRQALHAATLGFEHPVTTRPLLFGSPVPPDLARLDEALAADHT